MFAVVEVHPFNFSQQGSPEGATMHGIASQNRYTSPQVKVILHVILYYNFIYYIYQKPKIGCVGRGDLTSRFKSCEIDRSQGILV